MTPYIENLLNKARWRRELAMRGHEGNQMTPQLAEALRAEIRAALEANGKPFDVNIARRVYDLAVAAKDMCVAATGNVKEAIAAIQDQNGPLESLDVPGTPESAVQASETFGARLIRELLATFRATQQPVLPLAQNSDADPETLVHALAAARKHGMHDIAKGLEAKLLGQALRVGESIDNVVLPINEDAEAAARLQRYGSTMHAADSAEYARIGPLTRTNGAHLADDGNVSRYDDTELRGRPSNHLPMDPIEREELEGK